jgi:hypothetical protein
LLGRGSQHSVHVSVPFVLRRRRMACGAVTAAADGSTAGMQQPRPAVQARSHSSCSSSRAHAACCAALSGRPAAASPRWHAPPLAAGAVGRVQRSHRAEAGGEAGVRDSPAAPSAARLFSAGAAPRRHVACGPARGELEPRRRRMRMTPRRKRPPPASLPLLLHPAVPSLPSPHPIQSRSLARLSSPQRLHPASRSFAAHLPSLAGRPLHPLVPSLFPPVPWAQRLARSHARPAAPLAAADAHPRALWLSCGAQDARHCCCLCAVR